MEEKTLPEYFYIPAFGLEKKEDKTEIKEMRMVVMATTTGIVKKRLGTHVPRYNNRWPATPASWTCWVLALLALLGGSISVAGFHYEAPSDCQWTLMNSSTALGGTSSSSVASSSSGHSAVPSTAGSNDVALHCRLRTINSQFDQTNFSVVPREHTASLTIECSDSLLYQR